MEHAEAFATGILGAGGGAALAAAAARALMREEVSKIVSAALAVERADMHERFAGLRERFATREDVLRLEGKIDVLIARLGG